MTNLPEKKPPKATTTTKKVKYVGTQTFINANTMEVEEMTVTSVEERDFNFKKVFWRQFLYTLDLIGNQRIACANYIIESANRDNVVIATVRAIAEATGVSLKTVATTMGILQDAGFLKKVSNGVYMINPDIIFQGGYGKRLNCLTQYQDIDTPKRELSLDEQIENCRKSMALIQSKLDKLLDEKGVVDTQIDGQYEMLPNMEIVERARPVKRSRTRKKGGDGNGQ